MVNDGIIDIMPFGGTSPYFASIDNGVTFSGPMASFSFASLGPGSYPVEVKDQNNCPATASAVTISAPGGLGFTNITQDVLCFGSNMGSISISAFGGSGVYTYSKNNGATFQAGPNFTNLIAGMYTMVVKDGNACQFSSNVTITESSLLSFTTSQVNATCNSNNDGTITVMASGGTSPYQYSINNGGTYQLGNSFSLLANGSYQVLVKDANNCATTATTITITQPSAVTSVTTKVDATACGASDGHIDVAPSGGTGQYFASKDNGATFTGPGPSFIFGSLPPGSYDIVLKDQNNCFAPPNTMVISSPGGISFASTKTDVGCNGGNTGSISITASGGDGNYSYSKDNGTSFQLGSFFNNLLAAAYPILVKDGTGCTFSTSITINEPTAVSFTFVANDVSCNGGTNGSLTIAGSGGNNTYSYSKDSGISYQASNNFINLAAGSYPIVVKDGNNCVSSLPSVMVTEPAVVSFSNIKTDVSTCTPGNEGIITVTASGGVGTYQYSKYNGITFQPSNIFSALLANTYPVVVKDGNGCLSPVSSIIISSPTAPDATYSGLSGGPYCTSSSNLTLTPVTAGGIFSGIGISGNTFSPSTAGAGTFSIQYNITVAGCSSISSQTVDVISNLINPSFSGLSFAYCASSSAITLLPVNLGGTFTGSGMAGNNFTPSVAGVGVFTIQYSVTSGGCSATSSKTVTVIPSTDPLCSGMVGGSCATVSITPKPSPATCTNSDGKIVFSIKPFVPTLNNTGVKISITGTSITNFSISRTNFNDSTFLGLPVGTYDYSIEYGDPSCVKVGQVTIDQSGSVGTPVISSVVAPICAGASTGSMIINVAGETGNTLEWSLDAITWNPFIVGNLISGIPQGPPPSFQQFISVRRNSSDPCNGATIITIQDQSTPVVPTYSSTDASCLNNDGSILITSVSGGTSAYAYTLDSGVPIAIPPTNSATLNGLTSGTHNLVITDSNNCSVSNSIPISFPGPMVPVDFDFTVTDLICFEDEGSIQLSSIQGIASIDYTYEILTGGDIVKTGPITFLAALGAVDISNLDKGNYQVRLFQNQTACPLPVSSIFKAFTINGSGSPLDTLSITKKISFPDRATGSMDIIVGESGSEPYELKLELTDPLFDPQAFFLDWTQLTRNTQNLQIEKTIDNLFAGTYTLSLRDGVGCEKIFTIEINRDTDLFIPNIFTPNGDEANEVFYIRNLPPNSKLMVADRWGKEIYANSNYQNDWKGGSSPDGVYYYKIILSNKTLTGWVEILRGAP